ncbi:MAG: hypothetical protein J6K19_06040 [Prevotella sp.]|nr:hypothetical protein [Prevotella sp.]
MRRITVSVMAAVACLTAYGQGNISPFKGYFYNDEYRIYIRMNLYDKDITVPGYEMFGNLPGYLGKKNNNFYWLITSGKTVSEDKAELELINDYGSEDLKATVTAVNDSTFILTQGSGSTLKVPNNRKWQKLPKVIRLKKE